MRRVKDTNSVTTPPSDVATGTVGWFGQTAIPITQEWANSIQGELSNLAQDILPGESITDLTQCAKTVKSSTGQNLILNPVFRLQRANASYTTIADATYIANRWKYHKTGSQVHNSTVVNNLNTTLGNYYYKDCLQLDTTTINATPADGEVSYLVQHIEGHFVKNVNNKNITLSFWIKSPVAGTFSVALTNQGTGTLPNNSPTVSFVGTYTVTDVNTWEFKKVVMPGIYNVLGSTDANTNWTTSIGYSLKFVFMAGATYQGVLGWQSGHFLSTSACANMVGATGSIYLTGVKLEYGATPSKFDYVQGEDRLNCDRYYTNNLSSGQTNPTISANSASAYTRQYLLPGAMRANPTVTLLTNAFNSACFPGTLGSVGSVTPSSFGETRTASSTGVGYFSSTWEADAELYGI